MERNELTDEQKLDILISKGMAALCEHIRQKMSETGRFRQSGSALHHQGDEGRPDALAEYQRKRRRAAQLKCSVDRFD